MIVQDVPTQWIQAYPCKSKTSQDTIDLKASPKEILQTTQWNLAKLVKISSGIIARPLLIDQRPMVLRKEQCDKSEKVPRHCFCNPVWRTDGGLIPGNVFVICATFKTSCKGDSANNSVGQFTPLDRQLSITLSLRKTKQNSISLRQKSFLVFSLDVPCMLVAYGKEILVADADELKNLDASEIYARRLNAKEVLTPKRRDYLIFPCAGKREEVRTSIRTRYVPDSGEAHLDDSQGEGNALDPARHQPDLTDDDDLEARDDFWSISENYIRRHHVQEGVKLCVPEERVISHTTQVQWCRQADKYDIGCIAGRSN